MATMNFGPVLIILFLTSACEQNFDVPQKGNLKTSQQASESQNLLGKSGSFRAQVDGGAPSYLHDSFRANQTGANWDVGHFCHYFKTASSSQGNLSIFMGSKPNAVQRYFLRSANSGWDWFPKDLDQNLNYRRFHLSLPTYSPQKTEFRIPGGTSTEERGGSISFQSEVHETFSSHSCSVSITNSGDRITGSFSCGNLLKRSAAVSVSRPYSQQWLSEEMRLEGDFQCSLILIDSWTGPDGVYK